MLLLDTYRVIKFAGQSFWRNIWLSIATIFIIILTLISVNAIVILNLVTQEIVTAVQEKIDISVYFQPGIEEIQIKEVESYLKSLSQVEAIKYKSAAENLAEFRLQNIDNPSIIESLAELEENPISATLNVTGKKLTDYESIIAVLDNSKYKNWIIDKNFETHRGYINRVQIISQNIQKVGIGLTATFTIIALLIVFNTIRVAIYTHREEVSIMKLVGASNHFIRSPFIVEGIIYAFVAMVLTVILLYPILQGIQPYLTNFFVGTNIDLIGFFANNFWQVFGLELLVVIFLNTISSSVAVNRYLQI
ncbi:MAG: hypothetical protein COT81_02270 [Candidatus Buchananbacteria bacterium CG10_big_fil_rev_8_21_14_0_10_42_9]|uniref:Cell division protein FtsX n=1 Tax=Candidatus Buchananbacteria bacterium CG10_big_fil_rev_8_21_14_0_10_42_9 TaxID=1974526 RepID=A0A2H0W1G4_9BACT|nr:MAG: hypothetical protein COT81_02270 [Candidatus Buchananbacteria bacterium CG10_big_fil_rev_8_21_14_0_10_42_9]